jgi:hypothetical protein
MEHWSFRPSNHRIGAHTCTNHPVPYGTALWGGAVPGTSCQATIAPSLRDISQQALVRLSEARHWGTIPKRCSAESGSEPNNGCHLELETVNRELGASPLYQGTVDFFTKYL